jgi:RimJ/RimL family protein N-acetyltransferase
VIALRGFESSDVPALVEICQDPEIPRWTLTPSPYTASDARAWLGRIAEAQATGNHVTFAIVDAGEGRLLGTAGLMAIDWALSCAEIGYSLAAHARGRGAASRAVALLADWAFGPLDLNRLELHIAEGNGASRAVAVRAGFHRVAEPLIHRPETAQFTDDIYFVRTRGRQGERTHD